MSKFRGLSAVTLALLAVLALPAAATADRSFTPRFTTNDTGDIDLVANMVLSCSTALAGEVCTNGRNGTGTIINNNFQMRYVDVDSNGTTFNSSSADLSLPAGSTVLFAGLYWGGQTTAGGGTGTGGQAPAPNPANNNLVLFDAPGPGGYATQTADQLDAGTGAQSARFQGFEDVTSEVAAAGNGTYTIANIQTGTGSDILGGWSLIVAYRDTTQVARNLTVFDGFRTVESTSPPISIPVSGFLTPPSGPVNTTLGSVTYEGDLGLVGDSMQLNSTTISDALNPATNIFNSSISKRGVRFTAKNPDFINQLGYDSDLYNADGILANSATSAVITVGTNGDTYFPGVITFATELFAPEIQPVKSSSDLNGGLLQHGDELEYTVRLTNEGDDGAAGIVVNDQIPAGTTYLPGSLEQGAVASGASCPAAFTGRTDPADADTAEFDSANNRVVFRAGAGATGATGGTLAPNQTQCIRFSVTVDDETLPGFLVKNEASVDFRGVSLGTPFVGVKSNGTVDTVFAPDLAVTKTHTGGSFIGGNSYDFQIAVENVGNAPTQGTVTLTDTFPASTFASINSITAPGWNCSASSGLTVSCTRSDGLAAGSSYPPIVVNATLVGSPPATVVNTATVSGGGDTNESNNSGTDSGGAAAQADLSITKEADPTTVFAGDQVTFTLEVQNLGPSTATDVEVEDVMAPNFTASSATSTQGTCNLTVVCDLNTLTSGQAETITIVATVNDSADGSTVTNTATITDNGTSTDPVPGNNEDEADVIVPPTADLSITKDYDPKPNPTAGATVTYTIEVTNNGPADATDVTVVDTVPPQIADAPAPTATIDGGSCSLSAGPPRTITCTIANLPEGDSATMEVTATIRSNAGAATVPNSVSVSANEADPNLDNNVDTASFLVIPAADLEVVKDGPIAAQDVGDEFNYTLTAQNLGPSDAYGVELVDTLPAGLSFVSSSNPDCSASGQVVTCALGTVDPSQGNERVMGPGDIETFTIRVRVTAAAGTSVTNAVEVEQDPDDPQTFPPTPDPVLENNSDEFTTPIAQSADLSITKAADPDPVEAGEDVTFTLTVTNNGPSDATDVEVTDDLPGSLTLVSATPEQGTCTQTDPVDCDLGTIDSGDSVEIVLVATVGANQTGNQIPNTAIVDSTVSDPDPTDNTATETVDVAPEADLSLDKNVDDTEVFAGENLTYTITVTNNGPNAATDVEVTDDLPDSLELVSATPDQGTCTQADPVECDLNTINNGDSVEIVIVVTVNNDQAGNTITNVASVESGVTDPNPDNNSDSATTDITPEAGLSITKSADPNPVSAGADVTYTLTVQNEGPNDANNVEVDDDLPGTLTLVSATPSQGTCTQTDPVACDLGTIVNGGNATVTIVATVASNQSGNEIDNTATVTSPVFDNNPNNNTDTEPVDVAPEADLSITKTASPDPVSVGRELTYTITVSNDGPNAATDVEVTDDLPASLTLVSATPDQGTCTQTDPVDCDLGTVGVDETVEITIVATVGVGAGGTQISNTATVDSPVSDPNTDNNSDDDTVNVTNEADLAVIKTVSPKGSVRVGELLTYTIEIENLGPDDAPDVTVTDTFSSAVKIVSAVPTQGTCDIGQPTECELGPLANGGSATVTITARPRSRGQLTNDVNVSSTLADSDLSNNDDSVSTKIERARIKVTKRVDDRRVDVGDVVKFEIVLRSLSQVGLQDIEVCDRVPRQLELIAAPGARIRGNEACWTVDLGPREARTFELRARALPTTEELRVKNVVVASGPDVKPDRDKAPVRVDPDDSGILPEPCPGRALVRC